MSQNVVGVVKKYKGKYYVFPETAEATVSDTCAYVGPERKETDNVFNLDDYVELPQSEWKRHLEITDKMTLGPYDTLDEAVKKSQDDFFDGYFEHGVQGLDEIDGVRLILTYKGKEVEEDEEKSEEILEYRLQNLEDFMDTQTRLNQRFLAIMSDLSQQRNVEREREKKGDEPCEIEMNGNKVQVQFYSEREVLQKQFAEWVEKQKWDTSKGEYTIAYWFEIAPMRPIDVDDEEIKRKLDTLLDVIPLLTKKQAWAFIKANRKDLERYWSLEGKLKLPF